MAARTNPKPHDLPGQPNFKFNTQPIIMNYPSQPTAVIGDQQSTVPSLRTLYFCDRTLGRALRTAPFCLFATFMIRWATQPVPTAVKIEKSPFDIWLAAYGPTVALVASVLASIIAVHRYLWVKRVLTEGSIIQGTVEELDVYEREASHSDTTPAFQRSTIRTYYATIRYQWQGGTRQVRCWLPLSGSNYKIFKGKETDLILLDSSPKKPLLRALYFPEFAPRKLSWWRWL